MAYDFRLVDYKQTIKVIEPNDHYEVRDYMGLSPLLVKVNQSVRVLVQSGYAVGWGVRVKPPVPLFSTHLEPRQVEVEDVDGDQVQFKTSWSYTMAIDDAQAISYATWQAVPTTIEVY